MYRSSSQLLIYGLMELILRNAFTHGTSTAHTTLHHLQQLINVVGSRPFLMFNNINTAIHLRFLNQFSISTHAMLAVRLGELIGYQCGGVETCEGDELPAVSELAEALDVGLLLVARHGGLPVEGWGKIVCEPT